MLNNVLSKQLNVYKSDKQISGIMIKLNQFKIRPKLRHYNQCNFLIYPILSTLL